jgi:hypothetical protein
MPAPNIYEPSVENSATARPRCPVFTTGEHGGVSITLDGSNRHVQLDAQDLDSVRLAYAQHVYRQQGATVERAVVVTGGWQTSKETSYVEASRAREGTDWFLARDELGHDGQDATRIRRLADAMRSSRAQTLSLAHPERPDPRWGSDFDRGPMRVLHPTSWLRRPRRSRERTPDRDMVRGR